MAPPEVEAGLEPARLLKADEERLRLAGATLARGGRFVLVVADDRLWPSAAKFLQALLPDHRFEERAPTSSDETSHAISDPLRDQPNLTLVLRIEGEHAGPIETLNLRRESLVNAAANFVVVLDGNDAHARFLREAPDCYSYRDLLVVLEGEPFYEAPPIIDLRKELGDIDAGTARARQLGDPRLRAERLFRWSLMLQRHGQMSRARELLDEAIAGLTIPEQELDASDRSLLALLYYHGAFGASDVETFRKIRKARDVLAPVADKYAEQFADIQADMSDAIGIDLEAVRDAVQRASWAPAGTIKQKRTNLAQAYWARDNVIGAREVLAGIGATGNTIGTNPGRWIELHLLLLVEEGAWAQAKQLLSSIRGGDLEVPVDRVPLDHLYAWLLACEGEAGAAQRIYEQLPSDPARGLALIRIAADNGRMQDAHTRIAQLLPPPWSADLSGIARLLRSHQLLLYLTEQDLQAGGSTYTREAMDARLAELRLHLEHTPDPDPPWDRIRGLLLQTDAYLKRHGAERPAVPYAEQAWSLAEQGATVLLSQIARRLVVASVRERDLDRAAEWLSRGLAQAVKHEHRGDEAHLRGLALWHATVAGGDAAAAESEMRAAIAGTGSLLIEASVLARIGTALARHDLLRRAQQIYRSLPWPAREGECLEALGETRIAEVRYRTYGLELRLAALQRRTEPPPITAVDDD